MCGDCVSYKVEIACFMGLAHRDNEAGGGGGGKRREVVEPVEDGIGRVVVDRLGRQQHHGAAGARHRLEVDLGQERGRHVPHPALRLLEVGRQTDDGSAAALGAREIRIVRSHGSAPSR